MQPQYRSPKASSSEGLASICSTPQYFPKPCKHHGFQEWIHGSPCRYPALLWLVQSWPLTVRSSKQGTVIPYSLRRISGELLKSTLLWNQSPTRNASHKQPYLSLCVSPRLLPISRVCIRKQKTLRDLDTQRNPPRELDRHFFLSGVLVMALNGLHWTSLGVTIFLDRQFLKGKSRMLIFLSFISDGMHE